MPEYQTRRWRLACVKGKLSSQMAAEHPQGEKPVITWADVAKYLAVTRPGLLTAPKELLDAVRRHLETEADAGRLTRGDLDRFEKMATKLGPYLD